MEYRSLNEYMKERFGCKVYKLSLNAGLTCPNRDGTIDTRGCIFCSRGGSGEFAADGRLSIKQQMESARRMVNKKVGNGKYMAYFQAFTNTYGSVGYLEHIYRQAMEPEDVVGISIATRPDCLGADVLNLLKQLNTIKPVWVELGLQTIHESTSHYIRRGYPLKVYDQAVTHLRDRGIEVITHIILGLPGETREMMKETVIYVGASGVQGVKLQLLHILSGTDLEKEYRKGRVKVMSREEYVQLTADCIALLPPDMVIHRMTGDGDKRMLLAPAWSADKKAVLGALQKKIRETVRPV